MPKGPLETQLDKLNKKGPMSIFDKEEKAKLEYLLTLIRQVSELNLLQTWGFQELADLLRQMNDISDKSSVVRSKLEQKIDQVNDSLLPPEYAPSEAVHQRMLALKQSEIADVYDQLKAVETGYFTFLQVASVALLYFIENLDGRAGSAFTKNLDRALEIVLSINAVISVFLFFETQLDGRLASEVDLVLLAVVGNLIALWLLQSQVKDKRRKNRQRSSSETEEQIRSLANIFLNSDILSYKELLRRMMESNPTGLPTELRQFNPTIFHNWLNDQLHELQR